ncbi:MFS transporter [Govanella unica]|uniref:MFS transporter n=1 Tax=Govanella unica TaxID=2975056 RepID=A0A9X3Z5R1_9PROT|nr:MFS transporter [Govania unica]MDA5192420.1 MFS transporter [Govania unica]
MIGPSSAPQKDDSPPTALGPLGHPVFRAVWLASMASNLGGLIQSVGASWMMTSITSSAHMVALVQASVTLPIMLLSLVAGAAADGGDRRMVMIWAQIFMLLTSVVLTISAWFGLITPWLLLSFTFLIGCGMAFNGPAWQASVGDMVPRSALPGAVALNSMGFNLARSLGPALGGAIVAAFGVAAAFAINAVSYLGLIIVLMRWRPEKQPPGLPREPLGMAMASGIRYVAMSPSIRVVLLRSAVFGFSAISAMALMPLVARDLVAGGPLTYGLLLGAFGVGAVAGALGSARLRQFMNNEIIVRSASIGFLAACVVTGVSSHLVLTMVALLLAGAGWVLALATFNVTVQMSAPRWVVARSLSLYQMAAFGGMALGSWIWGLIAGDYGVAIALYVAAFVQLICVLLGFWLRLPDTLDINLDPLRRWKEPETAVRIEPRSGPVVVSIEFLIRETDIPEFLRIMTERRRVRLRDGARDWTLLRDLANPELWIERYRSPTWLDYVRHNSRMTQADASITDRLYALHLGPERPLVHRMIERQTTSFPDSRVPGARELAEPLTDPNRWS